MSRAAGRRNLPRAPRLPEEPANDAQGKQAGESARQDPAGSPIPGLTGNITNYETVHQKPATPDEDFDYNRGIMAHGVPNDSYTPTERALLERDGTLAQHDPLSAPDLTAEPPLPTPIPVYITTPHAGGKPLGTLAAQKITIPAAGSDPVRIASRDFDRTDLYLMVETAAGSSGAAPTGIRIDNQISNLSAGNGALLRAGMATYQNLDKFQDELFAVSNDGSACTLSVLYLYQEEAAG